MNLVLHFQQAKVNLLAAKLRTFLAVLGILVGTAAVVALMSCGQLATQAALEQFKQLGTNLLSLSVYQKTPTASNTGDDNLPLTYWREIPKHVPGVSQIAPYSTAYPLISFESRPLQGVVIGADENLAQILKVYLSDGHFVSSVESFEHFCVIGDQIAEQLRRVTLDSPIGKHIRIGQVLYAIIGVMKPWQENTFFNENMNRAVVIPVAGMPLISKNSKVNYAVMLLNNRNALADIIQQIETVVLQHAPKAGVFFRSAQQIITSMENQGEVFSLLLAVIGGISLLVGGIGIMNVMLVSVSERKKEIGIRKAVGAKNREIQGLFLMESALLSFIGGCGGVLLGLLITVTVAKVNHWEMVFFWTPPLVGFLVSVVTGIFFGFYPANRAAKLQALVSLRNE